MLTSRSVPQQTAQIFSAFAGQKRPGLRFWQIGQFKISPEEQQKLRISRHDDFIVEAPGGDDEQERAHRKERQRIGPQVRQTGAAKNDAAGDVDEVRGRNKKAQSIEKLGHGFAREDVSREKDAGENGQKRQLHGVRLGSSFAGN